MNKDLPAIIAMTFLGLIGLVAAVGVFILGHNGNLIVLMEVMTIVLALGAGIKIGIWRKTNGKNESI